MVLKGNRLKYQREPDILSFCNVFGMRAKFGFVIASLGLLAAAAPVFAHHSFAAEYDNAKPITLTGTVTKVEWMNPHARFYINVKDERAASSAGNSSWAAPTVWPAAAGPAIR